MLINFSHCQLLVISSVLILLCSIVCVGGDGTVGRVVTAMLNRVQADEGVNVEEETGFTAKCCPLPIGIIPTGEEKHPAAALGHCMVLAACPMMMLMTFICHGLHSTQADNVYKFWFIQMWSHASCIRIEGIEVLKFTYKILHCYLKASGKAIFIGFIFEL